MYYLNTKEKDFLKSLPLKAFYVEFRGERIVHKDCHIVIDNNFYSVPFKYVGQKVEVEINAKEVKILHENHQVALHTRQIGKGNFATQTAHYPKYKYYTPDSVEYLSAYKEKMNSLGKETEDLFSLIVKEHPQRLVSNRKRHFKFKKKIQ